MGEGFIGLSGFGAGDWTGGGEECTGGGGD